MARNPVIQEVTLAQVKEVAHRLAQELMEWGEPIPAFETRFPERLESCLKTPFQKFNGKSLYPGIVGKGTALFYFMVKSHPFKNGNKRVAIMTLLYFLNKNDWWLSVDNDTLYQFANNVAKSDPKDKSAEMEFIRRFIRKYLTRTKVV
jgi:death on curing protein